MNPKKKESQKRKRNSKIEGYKMGSYQQARSRYYARKVEINRKKSEMYVKFAFDTLDKMMNDANS